MEKTWRPGIVHSRIGAVRVLVKRAGAKRLSITTLPSYKELTQKRNFHHKSINPSKGIIFATKSP